MEKVIKEKVLANLYGEGDDFRFSSKKKFPVRVNSSLPSNSFKLKLSQQNFTFEEIFDSQANQLNFAGENSMALVCLIASKEDISSNSIKVDFYKLDNESENK